MKQYIGSKIVTAQSMSRADFAVKYRGQTVVTPDMVRDEGYLVVDRVGEGHWMFLDMKTRNELLVSTRKDGTLRATVEVAQVTPPRRCV